MRFKNALVVAAAALLVAAGSLYPLPMAAGDEKSKETALDVLVETTDENTRPPKLIESTTPTYPAQAAAFGLSAGVVLKAVINTKGGVKKLGIVEAYVTFPDDMEDSEKATLEGKTEEIRKMFTDSALEAARTFKFKPALRDGKPVEITVKIPIQYKLH